jgi:hypothetical protein
MPFKLDKIVPWGRSLAEYRAMFALTEAELQSRILGCADGPASFNAEMSARNRLVISVDPIYRFPPEEIRRQISATYPTMIRQLHENLDDYIWTRIPSPEALGRLRLDSMNIFLRDLPGGILEGRYLPDELPALPFKDRRFDIALCSHFLFLYSDRLSTEFHLESIREMLRVAEEVRIFSLLALDGNPSSHLNAVCRHFRDNGRTCEINTVDYEFQRNGNRMLRIR